MLSLLAPTETDSDKLVERAVYGDREAFGALYDLFVLRIYRYVLIRVRNHHDAEDLAEQVFMKAWLSIGRYRPRGTPFLAWLFTIASNVTRDHFRRYHTNISLEATLLQFPCRRSAVELTQTLDADEIGRAMLRLAPDQRQTIELRFFQDLDYEQTAARMSRRQGAVRALQMRALMSLQRLLTADA